MTNFAQTKMGQEFFESTSKRIARSLERLVELKEEEIKLRKMELDLKHKVKT